MHIVNTLCGVGRAKNFSPNIRPSHRNHVVGGLFAFLEDIGHTVGVAHLNKPITHRSREAIIDAVEAARFPRGDILLLFLFHFQIHHIVAAYAKADLWPDAQSWNHGFILIILVPFAEIEVEQQRHVDVVRLLLVADGVVAGVQAFFRTRSLPRIKHIDFSTDDGTLWDERDANTTSEVGAEGGAIVPADAHSREGWTEHQAAAELLGHQRTCTDEPKDEQYEQFLVFHGMQFIFTAKVKFIPINENECGKFGVPLHHKNQILQ